MRRLLLLMTFAVVVFAGLGVAANAQTDDQVVVSVPFEFVVAGTTLPAGTYHVDRLSDDPSKGLVFRDFENHVTVAVLVTDVKNTSAQSPKFIFKTAGALRFLNQIQTADHVFNFPVSKTKFTEALAHNNTNPTGALGE
jgi:hypothetical protein